MPFWSAVSAHFFGVVLAGFLVNLLVNLGLKYDVLTGIPELAREATYIFIWCLTRHSDCYKQWENICLDNLEASLLIGEKLTEEGRQL
ncbi:hypothetical protein ACET3Z_000295 [Daucus carota]